MDRGVKIIVRQAPGAGAAHQSGPRRIPPSQGWWKPPSTAATLTMGEYLADRVGGRRPAIESDFDVYLVGTIDPAPDVAPRRPEPESESPVTLAIRKAFEQRVLSGRQRHLGQVGNPVPWTKRGRGSFFSGAQVVPGIDQPVQIHHRKAREVPHHAGCPGPDHAVVRQHAIHDHRTHAHGNLPIVEVLEIDEPTISLEVDEPEPMPASCAAAAAFPLRRNASGSIMEERHGGAVTVVQSDTRVVAGPIDMTGANDGVVREAPDLFIDAAAAARRDAARRPAGIP